MNCSILRRTLVGVACSIGMTLTCHANIVFIGGLDIDIPADFGGVYLDIQENSVVETTATGAWDFNPFFGGAVLHNDPAFQPVRDSVSSTSPVLNLSLGTLVDGTSTFSSGFGNSGADPDTETHMAGELGSGSLPFTSGSVGYIGFSWDHDGDGGAGTDVRYGWLRVTLNDDGSSGTVHAIGYEVDPGVGILVGAIPEPTVSLLAILGAFGLFFRRRR
ncbi:MAG: hypothetical protein AAGA58_11040 [Verrucomicrobiota bacterium]